MLLVHPKPLNWNLFQVSAIPTYGLSKIPQVSCHRCKKAVKIASKYVRSFSVRENWALYKLGWQRIKATYCIIKVVILRGNTTWCYLALRDWSCKQINHMATSASLCEGPFLYFYALTFMQRVKGFLLFLLFFSFGKHHVVRKDLGTYDQLNIDSMSYYCWYHP